MSIYVSILRAGTHKSVGAGRVKFCLFISSLCSRRKDGIVLRPCVSRAACSHLYLDSELRIRILITYLAVSGAAGCRLLRKYFSNWCVPAALAIRVDTAIATKYPSSSNTRLAWVVNRLWYVHKFTGNALLLQVFNKW